MANTIEYKIKILKVGATAAIVPNSINTTHIAPGGVTTTDLADGTVTTVKLADGAVTTAKLADGAITAAKFAAGAFQAAVPTSLALSGAPTAPTAAAGTNTTQIATTAFVKAAIDSLIAGAPGTLDTLNELAVALQNEQSLSASFTTSLAGKAAIDAANLSAGNVTSWQTKLGLGALAYLGSANTAQLTDGAVTTAKLADNAVSYAKIQNVAANRLLGNPTGTAGDVTEIPLGAGLAWSGGALVASGGGANVAGSGTVNRVAKFTSSAGIGDSTISDDGTTVIINATARISSTSPTHQFYKSDASTDQKFWRQYITNSGFVFGTVNDAYSSESIAYVVSRSAASVSTHSFRTANVERLYIDDDEIRTKTLTTHLGYGATAAAYVEVGAARTTDAAAAIDLHSISGGATDYEARIIRNGGANGTFDLTNTGTGAFRLMQTSAAAFEFVANGNTYASILANGTLKLFDLSSNRINHLSIVGGSNGAGIELIGDGATTPTKYIRAKSGNLEFVNSAYSGVIATLTDAGIFTAAGFKIGANQVVGARDTGWAAMTGTANKATVYDTSTVTLAQLAGRVMSLQAALTTHGLLGA